MPSILPLIISLTLLISIIIDLGKKSIKKKNIVFKQIFFNKDSCSFQPLNNILQTSLNLSL